MCVGGGPADSQFESSLDFVAKTSEKFHLSINQSAALLPSIPPSVRPSVIPSCDIAHGQKRIPGNKNDRHGCKPSTNTRLCSFFVKLVWLVG
jgi:hypothetical protein